eukprot:TRINITY_DN3307_c0_g1_i1.p1 TRINITY_DN3307_c0_g1~~TRINITY_DN3307_c0_g1_i1.p1  ORF type:complete len:409 (-),score=48.34 TRINITY_DN3307_c0_g1_i1:30-1178(-)
MEDSRNRPQWALLPGELALRKRSRIGALLTENDGAEAEEEDTNELSDVALKILRSTENLLGSNVLSSGDLPLRYLPRVDTGITLRSLEFHPSKDLVAILQQKQLQLLSISRAEGVQQASSVKFGETSAILARFINAGQEIAVLQGLQHGCLVDVETGVQRSFSLRQGVDLRRVTRFLVSPFHTVASVLERDGVRFLSTTTWHTIAHLSQSMSAMGGAFDPLDPYTLWTCGGDQVYTWDLRQQQPITCWQDHSLVSATAIAVSGGQIAVGTESGFVNVYNRDQFTESARRITPIKSVPNLTMPVTQMAYHPKGEMLGIMAAGHEGQLRMVHSRELKVFPNFPSVPDVRKPYSHFGFTATGKYLCLARQSGNLQIAELRTYADD